MVNQATGEIRTPRFDPDARSYTTGDRRRVWGSKFQIMATRGREVNERVVLSVRWSKGNEADDAVEAALDLARLQPSIQTLIYDGALRGTHLNRLMHEGGIIGISPVSAAPGQGDLPRKERAPRETVVGPQGFRDSSGTDRTIVVVTSDGRAGGHMILDDGSRVFAHFEQIRVMRRANRRGTYRMYGQFRIPACLGGPAVITLPFTETPDEVTHLARERSCST